MNGSSVYVMIAAIAVMVLWRRTRSMYRPIRGSGIRLLIPLIFVLPGLSLILSPEANEPAWAFGAAFGLGRQELSDIDPQGQLALFMAVAFGYLIPWRIVSFLKFRQLT